MAETGTIVDPRFSKYNNTEIEKLLDQVAAQRAATETDVRQIVSGEDASE